MHFDALTAAEYDSLKQVRYGGDLSHIPPEHVKKFLGLRLIRDHLGKIVLTLRGRVEAHIGSRALFCGRYSN